MIAVEDGIVSARTIRARPQSERWDAESVLKLSMSVAANCRLGRDPREDGGLALVQA